MQSGDSAREGLVAKGLRWSRLVRAGMSPVSLVRRHLFHDYTLRFKGVQISASDLPVAWDMACPIWSGEYDEPGFVPRSGETVVDIGGNIGAFAMLAASRGAQVRSYEPHPESFEHMRRNVAKWDVECHQAAVVTGGTDQVRLFVSSRNIRNTLIGKDVMSGEDLSEHIDVRAIPLAEVLREPVDLLKIDIEGGEFDLLQAEPQVLRQASKIIAEVHTALGDEAALLASVQQAGFDAELKQSNSTPEAPYLLLTAVRS